MTQRIYIKEMEPNQMVEGIFAIQNNQLGLTRAGKPYIKCLLGDKSGRVPGRMWNTSEELFESLPHEGFVQITGQTQPYQGELQIIIQQISPSTPTRQQLIDLLPSTKFDITEMFNELRQILGKLQSPAMRNLAEAYLNDKELMKKFVQAPAAQSLHHAYLGGLLEHTLSLMRGAAGLLPHYPALNADLVLTGLFIHDIGKCEELFWETGFGYTDEGKLIGHIAQGLLILDGKIRQLTEAEKPLPPAAANVLRHIIISHHGKPEFGALKPPSTPEALFISLLDNLDAKMQMAIEPTRESVPASAGLHSDFTEKIWALDNARLYRPDPLGEETPANTQT